MDTCYYVLMAYLLKHKTSVSVEVFLFSHLCTVISCSFTRGTGFRCTESPVQSPLQTLEYFDSSQCFGVLLCGQYCLRWAWSGSRKKTRPYLREHNINPWIIIGHLCHWKKESWEYGGGRHRGKPVWEFEENKDHLVAKIRHGFLKQVTLNLTLKDLSNPVVWLQKNKNVIALLETSPGIESTGRFIRS